jgi:hypothetical protein
MYRFALVIECVKNLFAIVYLPNSQTKIKFYTENIWIFFNIKLTKFVDSDQIQWSSFVKYSL